MHSISTTAALALLGLASAAPTGNVQANNLLSGSFVVSNVPTGNNVTRDGPAALNQALSRYGFTTSTNTGAGTVDANQGNVVSDALSSVTSSVAAANRVATSNKASPSLGTGGTAAGSEQGEVSADSQSNDLEYTSQIQVGGQTIQVNFDTGSSDLWLFNTKMPSSMTAGHTLYDPTKSKNFTQIQGATFSVSYGDTSNATGNLVGTDIVNIGGADFENQVIELPNQVTDSFVKDTKSNGLVGLAFGKLNTVKPTAAKTFIENIANQLKQPVFTANLKHAATGSYEFGNIDTTSYSGNMVWAPVDQSRGYWQFTSNFYAVKSHASAKNNNGASPAIADTGTSLLLMDPVVVTDYYAQVPGAAIDQTAGGYTFPCTAALPDLFIGISGGLNGGQMNQIPGSLMNYAPTTGGKCFGGLQSNNGGGLQILGDILFKSAFIAFNYGNSSLGFAAHTAN